MNQVIRNVLIAGRIETSTEELQEASQALKQHPHSLPSTHYKTIDPVTDLPALHAATFSVDKAVKSLGLPKNPGDWPAQVRMEALETAFSPLADGSPSKAFALGGTGNFMLEHTDQLSREIGRTDFLGLGTARGFAHNFTSAPKFLEQVKAAGKDPLVLLEGKDTSSLERQFGAEKATQSISQHRAKLEKFNAEYERLMVRQDWTAHQKACYITTMEVAFGISFSAQGPAGRRHIDATTRMGGYNNEGKKVDTETLSRGAVL